jgi:ribosomal protein S14
MTSSDFDDEKMNKFHEQARLNQNCHRTGRKRALLRKYSKAIALSTTLIYGPMTSAPFARRSFIGSSNAHAAASTTSLVPSSGNAYNFQDFKDVKKKLSLAPGANVQAYEEILERVAVEGDDALQGMKPGEMEAALTIGKTSVDSGESAAKETGKKKIQKKQSKKQQVSEWESDEFGFGEDDDDDIDSGVLKIGSSASSPSEVKGKAPSVSGDNSGKGDVVVTDKMAYNNYQAALNRKDHMKTIKKGAFYSIFPVFVITMIRGQVRAYIEKKKVKRGLALFEQEKKDYIEERKKQGSKGEDDDDDDDDDQDDKSKDNKKGKK